MHQLTWFQEIVLVQLHGLVDQDWIKNIGDQCKIVVSKISVYDMPIWSVVKQVSFRVVVRLYFMLIMIVI